MGPGKNYSGHLGGGTATYRSTPVRVRGLSGVRTISGGSFHSLAEVEDTTRPRVTAVKPAYGATGVSPRTNVVVTFSEYAEKSTLTGALGKSNFGLYKVTPTGPVRINNATVTPSVSGTRAALNPYGTTARVLAKGTRYKAVVSSGVTDLVGNAMAANKAWYFKTGN